ncbi:MAG: M48 family metalloprotease [Sphingorhabdus sp.]
MMRTFLMLFALLATPAFAAPKAETVAAYRAIAAQDARLATVGYRLATTNAPFCGHRLGFNPGWVLHDIAQYPDADAARAAFAFAQPVEVAFVVKGGEAEKQGVQANDGVMRIGNRDLASFAQKQSLSTERIDAVRTFLDDLWGPNHLAPLRVQRGTETRELLFQLAPVCASHFWVDANGKIDAGADGERVRVTSALIDFVKNDDELAAVAAHELAHNLLGHPADMAKARKGKSVAAMELDADRLSVWLLSNAGYDPQAPLAFWQRCGPKSCAGLFRNPGWKKRVAAIKAEIDLMVKTPAKNDRRDPPLLSAIRKAR